MPRMTPSRGEVVAEPRIGSASARDISSQAAATLARIRARAPRVHCITNNVAQNFTANMLLAAGAVPSMSHAPEEVADFAERADAILVNLGTLDAERRGATRLIADIAVRRGKPWALDPVFVQASAPRRALAVDLLQRGPTVVRANAEELAALAVLLHGDTPEIASKLAAQHGTVICRTGPVDLISDGARTVRIANGHPMMARVTAMGCAGTALLCAALAVEPDPFVGAVATLLILGVAGEMAAERSAGPGSFAAAFLDIIYAIDENDLASRARAEA